MEQLHHIVPGLFVISFTNMMKKLKAKTKVGWLAGAS